MLIDSLDIKYQKTIAEYLKVINQAKAYKKGFGVSQKTANSNAHVFFNRPDIKAAIREVVELQYLSESETLMQLSKIARGEIGNYITSDGWLDFEQLQKDNNGFLVKKVKRGKAFDEWEAVDPLKAMEMLLKVYKTFDDKPVVNVNVNYESLEEKLEALRAKIAD